MTLEQTKHKMGRPSLLTDETEERIVSAVRGGAYLDDASAYAGISRHTLFSWMRDGRAAAEREEQGELLSEREQRLVNFLNAVEKARADASIRNLMVIQQAAQEGNWQASAWYLERTNPKKWGRHETVEITGADGGPVQVEVSAKDTLRTKFEAAERAALEVLDVAEIEPAERQNLSATNE
jgi:hypothetical protein